MRRLTADEQALWRRVTDTVRPMNGRRPQALPLLEPVTPEQLAPKRPALHKPRGEAHAPAPALKAQPGSTLDGSWDRRLTRGLVQPDVIVDLHGHSLADAHHLLDRRLEQAIAGGVRTMLLVTGKPPRDDRRPIARGAIRAAVGDWLAASRHASAIAAVRNAHPRHGGTGALYLIFRRRR